MWDDGWFLYRRLCLGFALYGRHRRKGFFRNENLVVTQTPGKTKKNMGNITFLVANLHISGWWFQPLWKVLIKLGSSSPMFGMKIPKIFELPPPRKYVFLNTFWTERVPEIWRHIATSGKTRKIQSMWTVQQGNMIVCLNSGGSIALFVGKSTPFFLVKCSQGQIATSELNASRFQSNTIHVWDIYLHLVVFNGKIW